MALSIITGSLSTTDVTLATVSVKCGFARMSLQINRGATAATTFCSTGWVEETPGMKQLTGSLVGYATKGSTWSDPLIWVTSATTIAVVATIDTGCTLTFAANIFGDGVDLVAAANSSRGVDFRSSGAVTSAWVTT